MDGNNNMRSIAHSTSATTTVSGRIKGSHRWKIEGFSSLAKLKKRGEYVSGAKFVLGKHTWALWLYPSGDLNNRTSISLYLALDSKSEAKVSFTFRLLNQNMISLTPLSLSHQNNSKHWEKCSDVDDRLFVFSEQNPKWGFADLISNNKLTDKDNGYLVGDTIVLEVEIDLFDEIEIKTSEPEQGLALYFSPPNTLHHDISSLLQTGLHSDVTIICEGQDIKAHKNILSLRSPVFRAMFAHEMKENKDSIIDIKDFDKTVILLLLEYIYTGELKSKISYWDQGVGLFSAADKYGLDQLTILSVPLIANYLTCDNVLATLHLSLAHSNCSGSEPLRHIIKMFTNQHFEQVLLASSGLTPHDRGDKSNKK